MKILHTADLHLGQVIYQNYDRTDEHDCFFSQLEQWCREERPDALVVSGDVFDIQQPSAATWKNFTDRFVRLHEASPGMHIVIVAGNHDSPPASNPTTPCGNWPTYISSVCRHRPAQLRLTDGKRASSSSCRAAMSWHCLT